MEHQVIAVSAHWKVQTGPMWFQIYSNLLDLFQLSQYSENNWNSLDHSHQNGTQISSCSCILHNISETKMEHQEMAFPAHRKVQTGPKWFKTSLNLFNHFEILDHSEKNWTDSTIQDCGVCTLYSVRDNKMGRKKSPNWSNAV